LHETLKATAATTETRIREAQAGLTSECGGRADHLADQVVQANAAAEQLDSQFKNLPSLLNACDESIAEMRGLHEEIPARIQQLRESSEQARNDLTSLQAAAQAVARKMPRPMRRSRPQPEKTRPCDRFCRRPKKLNEQLAARQDDSARPADHLR